MFFIRVSQIFWSKTTLLAPVQNGIDETSIEKETRDDQGLCFTQDVTTVETVEIEMIEERVIGNEKSETIQENDKIEGSCQFTDEKDLGNEECQIEGLFFFDAMRRRLNFLKHLYHSYNMNIKLMLLLNFINFINSVNCG